MDPPTTFGPIDGKNIIAGTHVSGGTLNLTINNSENKPSTSAAPCHTVPFPRNEDIIHRAAIFSKLDALLPPSREYQGAALWGLGGSGKTQIALEYAHRRSLRDPPCSVFWVHADNETTFAQDYKLIAAKLGLPADLGGTELLAEVRRRIEADPCWLLVIDNADDLGLFGVGGTQARGRLYDFVPRGPVGTVLWTSRDKRIAGSLVGAQRAINVARMTDSEAMGLLETVGAREVGEGERGDAVRLLAELDWLPLALSQAAAYMRRMSVTPREYLSKLARRKRRWEILQTSEFDRHRRPELSNSILETWDISMEQIRRENKMAYDILHVLAFLDSQNIPLEIIKKAVALGSEKSTIQGQGDESATRASAGRSGSSGSDGKDGDDEVLLAVLRLQEFSFLHPRAPENKRRAYDMHKLVQEAARYALSGRDRRKDEARFSKRALEVVTELFPERRRELWEECERYVMHAQRVGEWTELCGGEIEASELLTQVSNYLYGRGRWREKEPVDKRAYELRLRRLGEKHPDTIQSLANLATSYCLRGRYKEAEKTFLEVLALRRNVLGEEHPATIWSMATLATVYHRQGRYEDAERIDVEALALQRDILGERHPDTILSLANLAVGYHHQERYEKAEKVVMEVLALRRDVLGQRHPDTIQSEADLAAVYYGLGRYEEAEKIEIEVLALRRDILGETHPELISSMANIATLRHHQGRHEEAEKMIVQVLALRRDVLGARHPDTIWSMESLAIACYVQQRHSEALVKMEDCFQLFGEVMGAEHPWTQRCRRTLERWKTWPEIGQ